LSDVIVRDHAGSAQAVQNRGQHVVSITTTVPDNEAHPDIRVLNRLVFPLSPSLNGQRINQRRGVPSGAQRSLFFSI
jgi:hypothetical protein